MVRIDSGRIFHQIGTAPAESAGSLHFLLNPYYRLKSFIPSELVNNSELPTLRLKPQRQFPFVARHPWVHASSLADSPKGLTRGEIVELLDHDGGWLGRGIVNPESRLRVRLYSFDQSVAISQALWEERIDQAIARRRIGQPYDPEGAERLIFSESDLLSGLIVDRYRDCLSVQFTSGGLIRWRNEILEKLQRATDCRAIRIRIDERTAKFEGIESTNEWSEIAGPAGVPEEPVVYRQNDLLLSVDLGGGQKTGGFLDQRINHRVAAEYLRDRRVLDVCCYTGGFGLVASAQGAKSVEGIDSSQTAIDAARREAARNELAIEFRVADCFDELKRLHTAGESYDAIVLDPPRFAGSRHQIDSAIRAYTRLNSHAVDLLPQGGLLVTCSCSGRVSRSDFLNMLMDVGRRRRRDLVLLENRGPAPDHPVAIGCPESDYLKCMIVQVN